MPESITFEELQPLLSSFKKEGEKRLSNCFLMPPELKRLGEEKKLFFKKNEDWLFLFCDRGDYINLYYYSFPSSKGESAEELLKTSFSKPVLLDVTFRGEKGDRETPQKLLSRSLAEEYKKYNRMQLFLSETDVSALKTEIFDGYRVKKEEIDFEAVQKLWRECLDEKSTPLPTKEEFEAFEKSGLVWAAEDEKNELGAVLLLDANKKSGLVQHLVCSPSHRRRGLARTLLNRCIHFAFENGVSVLRLWVDAENKPAIALYEKTGFAPDLTVSEQMYIKQKSI